MKRGMGQTRRALFLTQEEINLENIFLNSFLKYFPNDLEIFLERRGVRNQLFCEVSSDAIKRQAYEKNVFSDFHLETYIEMKCMN